MMFQKLVLPAAIRDRMDIIGAAETGSGKTLAFGIPIIHGILTDKHHEAECVSTEAATRGLENSEQEADFDTDQVDEFSSCSDGEESLSEDIYDDPKESDYDTDKSISDTENMNDKLGCVKVIDIADFSFMERNNRKTTKDSSKKLRALIVTPTRELAVQVRCKLWISTVVFFTCKYIMQLYHSHTFYKRSS